MATSNNEWLHFYQNNLTGPPQSTAVQFSGDHGTTAGAGAGAGNVSNQLSRVTRPTNPRRRSRASRRTPTTLLNTDTANFRAMVQQFTGAGGSVGGDPATVTSDQFLSSYNTNSSSFDSGIGLSDLVASPPANDGYNVEFWRPYNMQYYRTAVDNGGAGGGGDGPPGFVERVQDGGMIGFKTANFSGENVNCGKNTSSMF